VQVFAVKTSIAHEKGVADMVAVKLATRNPRPDIKSILVLDQLRGYIFVEAPHQRDVMMALSEIKHVKGKALGQVKLEELDSFIKPEPITMTLEIGDKVEIIAGLFVGEQAYVARIDEAKDEVTLSLTGSDNPIPLKVLADYLKIIEKGAGHDIVAAQATAAGEIAPKMVGRGIKEYTLGGKAGEKEKAPEMAVESFGDESEKEEEPEPKEKMPEVVVYTGRKQKVVGELIDLNVDEDEFEDEFEDKFEEEYEEKKPDESFTPKDKDEGDVEKEFKKLAAKPKLDLSDDEDDDTWK